MKLMKGLIHFALIVFLITGCVFGNNLVDDKIESSDVDEVQMVMAMGNPEYGAESRIITNNEEVDMFIECINNATIGETVDEGDVGVGENNKLFFRKNGEDIYTFVFKDPSTIWHNAQWYYIKYENMNPFELYSDSFAMMTVVDELLEHVDRPIPMVTSEQVRVITSDMIYRDIVDLLGYTKNIGSGVIVLPYIVDKDKILKISLFGEDVPCQRTGEEWLETLEEVIEKH